MVGLTKRIKRSATLRYRNGTRLTRLLPWTTGKTAPDHSSGAVSNLQLRERMLLSQHRMRTGQSLGERNSQEIWITGRSGKKDGFPRVHGQCNHHSRARPT